MKKRKIMFGLVCAIVGLAGCALSGESVKLSAVNDPNEAAVAMQAFELRMAGNVDKAIELLKKAVAEYPGNGPAQFELARDYFCTLMDRVEHTEGTLKQRKKAMKKQLTLAEKAIKKAVKADPANPRYHYWAGRIGTYNVVYDAHSIWTMPAVPVDSINVIKSYEKAIMLKPDFHQARQELMGLYDRLPWYCGGNKSKAQEHAKKLEQMDPIYGARARCEIRPRKSPEEKTAIWKVALRELADIERKHGNNDRAQALEKQAKELDPDKLPPIQATPVDDLNIAPADQKEKKHSAMAVGNKGENK
ncbi:hypothetical protein ACFL3G_04790 [Planctomycetota bacterium]